MGTPAPNPPAALIPSTCALATRGSECTNTAASERERRRVRMRAPPRQNASATASEREHRRRTAPGEGAPSLVAAETHATCPHDERQALHEVQQHAHGTQFQKCAHPGGVHVKIANLPTCIPSLQVSHCAVGSRDMFRCTKPPAHSEVYAHPQGLWITLQISHASCILHEPA